MVTTWDGEGAAAGGRIIAAGDPAVHAEARRILLERQAPRSRAPPPMQTARASTLSKTKQGTPSKRLGSLVQSSKSGLFNGLRRKKKKTSFSSQVALGRLDLEQLRRAQPRSGRELLIISTTMKAVQTDEAIVSEIATAAPRHGSSDGWHVGSPYRRPAPRQAATPTGAGGRAFRLRSRRTASRPG